VPSSRLVVPDQREGNDANAEGYDENIHRSSFHIAFRRVSILNHLYNIGSAEAHRGERASFAWQFGKNMRLHLYSNSPGPRRPPTDG
jgi:hypothetical protein